MSADVKVRNSFGTGFGMAFGCLTAIVVFFFGGCVLMIGSCASVIDSAIKNAPTKPPLAAPSQPNSNPLPIPTFEPEAPSTGFRFKTISQWDNGGLAHSQTVFVENANKADIAAHALRVRYARSSTFLDIHFYDNEAATPRLETGTPPYYPDSSDPYLVAVFVNNPSNGHFELMFRKDVQVGEAVTGEVAELVRNSEIFFPAWTKRW